MAKRKKGNPWDGAFDRIRSLYWPQFKYPPKPIKTEFDAVESELNCQFPASYRAFAELFGLGGTLHSLPHVLPLTRPAWVKDDHWAHAVVDATRFYQTYDWATARASAPTAFLQRLIVFALDGGYHTFAFDPLDVTDRLRCEYRVYDVNRSDEATAIATSFDGWLRWIDQHYRFSPEEAESSGEPEFRPVFKPDSPHPDAMMYYRDSDLREKKKPGDRSVKRWLAHSNVRDLALAIRDHGRADAFPALADALQEAGCANVDVLDSCRRGDPDIDGVWVLRVLLGEK